VNTTPNWDKVKHNSDTAPDYEMKWK